MKKKVLFSVATLVAGSSLLWVSFGNHTTIQTPSYTVKQVVDGDSFYLTNGLEIRLANINAPEYNLCGGPEAKKGLEKILIGKPIYLTIITQDQYHRLISMVYTNEVFVNAEMLRLGQATYPSSTVGYNDILKTAIDEARSKERGIHGPPCTQKINTLHPSCNIKGNINDGKKYYYTPACGFYNQTFVQLYLEEQWFCTEQEAKTAGYTLAPRCK